MNQAKVETYYSEHEALKRFDELTELGYNVSAQQINLLAWEITYWLELS